MLLDAALAVIAFGPCAHPSVAGDVEPCPYTVTQAGAAPNCGFWGPAFLQPQGLNNLGHWVGYRNSCPDNQWEIPIKWTPEGGLVNIPIPAQTNRCRAYDINDLGTVVGVRSGVTDGKFHGNWACVWLPNGQFIEIPPLGGNPPHSWATAVNNSDVVVGDRWITTPVGFRLAAFIWCDDKIVDIDPTHFDMPSASARDVSNTGYVVGHFGDSSVAGRAFRWKDGTVQVLSLTPGAIGSGAYGVTDEGLVAGHCRFQSGSELISRATIWGLDGVPVELPPLPGYGSWSCLAINNSGVVLGSVSKPTDVGLSSTQQVIWIDGIPYAIRSLIDAPNPNQFGETRDLNTIGQILGRGHVPPAGPGGTWILTPTGSIADLNGDCIVDGVDLSLLLEQWSAAPDVAPTADLNQDGLVDGCDLAILLGAWTGTG